MARLETDREDLLGEATALVERIEFAPSEDLGGEQVVVGFRAGGAMSVFFDADDAYHFNTQRELRRAYCDGRLIKAERRRLVAMRRVRQPGQTELQRRDLDEQQQTDLLSALAKRLLELADRCRDGRLVAIGQVPEDANVFGRVIDEIANYSDIRIAVSPNVR